MWDLTTGEGIGDTLRSGDVSSIAVTSVKGVTIAVATTESTVRAWSLGLS